MWRVFSEMGAPSFLYKNFYFDFHILQANQTVYNNMKRFIELTKEDSIQIALGLKYQCISCKEINFINIWWAINRKDNTRICKSECYSPNRLYPSGDWEGLLGRLK